MRIFSRRALALLLGACTCLSLSSCAKSELPTPAKASETARPAVAPSRFVGIEEKVLAQLSQADQKLDVEAMSPRASGSYLRSRTGQYRLKAIMADAYNMEALSTSPANTVISSAATYPHLAMAVMNPPEGTNMQNVDVFVQENARSQWSLWSRTSLLPGATLPALRVKDEGGEVVAAEDANGLVASPQAAVAVWVQLNQTRQDSAGLSFADDPVRTSLAKSHDNNVAAVQRVGTASMNFAGPISGIYALRTEDGGALAFTDVDFSTTINVTKAGSKVKLASQIGAFATGQAGGEIIVTKQATTLYTLQLAFYIPPADASDNHIKVVAASDPVIVNVENQS